jgi:glycogen synthase
MRVMFWAGTFWPAIGGVEVLAAKLLPALRDRGYEYVVVTPKNDPDLPDEDSYEGIPVHRLLFFNNLNHSGIDHVVSVREKVMKLKRSFAPDLIHINSAGLSDFFHLTTANAHPSALLVSLHGEFPDTSRTIIVHTLRAADWVVGCSSDILERARQLEPDIRPRSSVIYNALEVPALLPTALPAPNFRLLCLGRLVPDKGFDLALQAFSLVIPHFPHTRLIIAGDGPERLKLTQQAAALRVRDFVDFVGRIPPYAVPRLLNSATAVVMPSRYESFGLVALEAALMARPVVATRVGGLPEVVLDGQTGLLADNEDFRALAAEIISLLQDPDLATQMGQTARCRALENFSWGHCVNAYDALYRRLIEGNDATCPV